MDCVFQSCVCHCVFDCQAVGGQVVDAVKWLIDSSACTVSSSSSSSTSSSSSVSIQSCATSSSSSPSSSSSSSSSAATQTTAAAQTSTSSSTTRTANDVWPANEDCPVCCESFFEFDAEKAKTIVYLNDCRHLVCHECLREWSKQKCTCPICRAPFTKTFYVADNSLAGEFVPAQDDKYDNVIPSFNFRPYFYGGGVDVEQRPDNAFPHFGRRVYYSLSDRPFIADMITPMYLTITMPSVRQILHRSSRSSSSSSSTSSLESSLTKSERKSKRDVVNVQKREHRAAQHHDKRALRQQQKHSKNR